MIEPNSRNLFAMPKVLLIDDDAELISLIAEYLEREGFEVMTAHNGEAGVAATLSGQPDIAVLDVMMPRQNGIDTLRRIRSASSLPVIMLTARGDEADRIIGLELGADDYVPKPCTPRELTARIRAILRRTQPALNEESGNTPLIAGHLTLWSRSRQAQWAGKPLELTSTEFNLLEVLAQNAGRPVSKSALSEQGLGRPLARFDRSIDVHVSSLRHKLGTMPDGRSCIQTIFRQGYQMVSE